jgi:hypothetical protein
MFEKLWANIICPPDTLRRALLHRVLVGANIIRPVKKGRIILALTTAFNICQNVKHPTKNGRLSPDNAQNRL